MHKKCFPALTALTAAALLGLIVPLAAQDTAFLSDFTADAVNPASFGPPTETSTAWVIGGTKTHALGVIGAEGFSLNLGNTSAAFVEAAAPFASVPIELTEAGDFIEVILTFTADAGILQGSANSQLGMGLYDSHGALPPEGVSGQILFNATGYESGGMQSWTGYSAILSASGGTHLLYVRPAQTAGSNNAAQELFFRGNTGGVADTTDITTLPGAGLALEDGAVYTLVQTISLSSPGSLTTALDLYAGAGTSGELISSVEGAASGATAVATRFDALAIGYIRKGVSGNSSLTCSSLEVRTNKPNFPARVENGPTNLTITTGGSGALSVLASGNEPITYQWFVDDVAIAEADTSTLSFSNADASIEGTYHVVVSNQFGSDTSADVMVVVTDSLVAPSIQDGPAAVSTEVGASVLFSSAFNGSSPLNYQWEYSGDGGSSFAPIADAQQNYLQLDPVALHDAGLYRVRVTNSVGEAVSAAVPLVLVPVITVEPMGAIVPANSAAQLSVAASAGNGSPELPTYQWFYDGEAIDGETAATYDLDAFTPAMSGSYHVEVSTSAGTVVSATVYLGTPITLSHHFFPANGSIRVNPDTQLHIDFSGPVKLGKTGSLTIRDAVTDAIVYTVDLEDLEDIQKSDAGTPVLLRGYTLKTVQGVEYYYQPIVMHDDEAWIELPSTSTLKYGHEYYFQIDAGVILDAATGASLPAITDSGTWHFTTRQSAPRGTHFVVNADGSGDYGSIQGAIDAVPPNNTAATPYLIDVMPGIYRERLNIRENRNYISIRGLGDTREDVQIVYGWVQRPEGSSSKYSLIICDSSDFLMQNLTVWVTSGQLDQQLAFFGSRERHLFKNVLIKSWQDTVANWNGELAYFYDCEIWGSVDFIYGGGTAYYDRCDIVEIRGVGGPISAPSTAFNQAYGLVFNESHMIRGRIATGHPMDVAVGSSTLQRPWRENGQSAFINCRLDDHISTKGWLEWDGRENGCRAVEYGSILTAGGTITGAERRAAGAYWVNSVDPDYDGNNYLDAAVVDRSNRVPVTIDPADYTVEAVMAGVRSFFGLATPWEPRAPVLLQSLPSADWTSGEAATLEIFATAVADDEPTFQWYKGGEPIIGADRPVLTIDTVEASDAGTYSVVVSNAYGSVSTADTAITVDEGATVGWSIGIASDSTAASYEPDLLTERSGWGQELPAFFSPHVTVENRASSGRSTKSFYIEGKWDSLVAYRADFVFIQFGHNDSSTDIARFTDPQTTYKDYLTTFVDDVRGYGGTPIFLTPPTRRNFNSEHVVRLDSLQDYATAMRELGETLDVAVLDVLPTSIEFFEFIGESQRETYQAKTTDTSMSNDDRTHFNAAGARQHCYHVIEAILRSDHSSLAPLKTEITRAGLALRAESGTHQIEASYNLNDWADYGEPWTVETGEAPRFLMVDGHEDAFFLRTR